MDLKEAIIHTRQVAEGCGVDSRDCAYQHDKLGDWLEELEAYRALGPIDHLRELVDAEKDGRCVVLPCHPGIAKLYFVDFIKNELYKEAYASGLGLYWSNDSYWGSCFPISCIGRSVFLTREEAEAALRDRN